VTGPALYRGTRRGETRQRKLPGAVQRHAPGHIPGPPRGHRGAIYPDRGLRHLTTWDHVPYRRRGSSGAHRGQVARVAPERDHGRPAILVLLMAPDCANHRWNGAETALKRLSTRPRPGACRVGPCPSPRFLLRLTNGA